MGPGLDGGKARWGDLTRLKDNPDSWRLFAVGTQGFANHVLYWDYDNLSDTFDRQATKMDVTAASDDNKLALTSVRALPGAVMLSGQSGALFFRYDSVNDTYNLTPVPDLLPNTTYSDFWCIPSGVRDDLMVFILLRKSSG